MKVKRKTRGKIFKESKKAIPLILILGLLFSCKKKENDNPSSFYGEYDTTSYRLSLPYYYPQIPLQNRLDLKRAKVALGKKLFYDPALSNDGRSCSGCHIQQESFSSVAVNSLPHINLIFSTNFLWNGKLYGAGILNAMHFEVKDFFQTNPDNINNEEYKAAFYRAYGSTEINNDKIAECLAQFIATLVTGNSKFDRYLRGEVMLTPSELNGFNIFNSEKGDCFHCHGLPLFTDNSFHNIGLDSVFYGSNQGLFETTHYPNDLGKFKTPTLYNIALTPPYMHDGRFNTLDEVIEHYNSKVKSSPTLDPIMTKAGKEDGLNLTPQEKADLKAFLLTLTDTSYINNPDFR